MDLYRVLGIGFLANRFPRRWEKYLGFIFSEMYVEVEMQVMGRPTADPRTGERMY